jgi:hypothetical protein
VKVIMADVFVGLGVEVALLAGANVGVGLGLGVEVTSGLSGVELFRDKLAAYAAPITIIAMAEIAASFIGRLSMLNPESANALG